MPWTNSDIRRLLRYLDTPRLNDEPLARDLQHAMRAGSAREAVLCVLEQAFDLRDPRAALLHDAIALRDLRRIKTRQVARDMHLSNRQYFRYRAMAIEAIARTVDAILVQNAAHQKTELQLAPLVARFDPDAALKLYRAASPNPDSRIAFEVLCTALRAGKPVSQDLIDNCEGPWRLLALAAIGRRFITQGEPKESEPWRRRVQLSLRRVAGAQYDQAAFELAYMDRLEAIRRCDMHAAREAIARMLQFAASNESLVGLALVAQVEQACDDADLEQADHILLQIERLNSAVPDFKVMARTAHAQATLAFVRGRYTSALNLADGAAGALVQVEPGFALCAHAYAGRAALQLGRFWEPPAALCGQYPNVWITGHIYSVHARHLLSSSPKAASQAVDRAINILTAQDASGALLYARATRGMVNFVLQREGEAAHDWVEAWEGSLHLGRASYLPDLFAHPLVDERLASTTLSNCSFVPAAQRRLEKLMAEAGFEGHSDRSGALADPLRFAIDASTRRLSAEESPRDQQSGGEVTGDYFRAETSPLEQLAADLSLLMPLPIRIRFNADLAAAMRRALILTESRSSRVS